MLSRFLFSKGVHGKLLLSSHSSTIPSIRSLVSSSIISKNNEEKLIKNEAKLTRNESQLVKRVNCLINGVPKRHSSAHSDHVALWTAEKVLSGILLPVIPAAFIFPSPIMDYLLAFTLTVHSHWGIEAIVVDYVRPSVFGELVPKIGVGLVYALSALTLGGLCYFTYTDVGLVKAIKMLWKL